MHPYREIVCTGKLSYGLFMRPYVPNTFTYPFVATNDTPRDSLLQTHYIGPIPVVHR